MWGAAGINSINRLQKLQSRATRIVTNSAYDASALSIIRKLGWPTINELRGEWPSGLYSLRQVTEVKLGRVMSKLWMGDL